MAKHICGACQQSFAKENEYLTHECKATGFTPKEVEHQDALTGGQFSKQSEAALERGEAKKGK